MNNLTYTFRENNVRVVMKNTEPWFVAKDIGDVLGLTNITMSLKNLEENEVTKYNLGGKHGLTNIVNESGMYALIFQSRKEEAKQFRKWVTSEVLPSIRKNGAYMTDDVLEKAIDDPDFMIGLLTKLKEEKAARLEAESTVAILTHVNKTYTSTEIAKENGFKSAIALNNELHKRGIQYKQNNTWLFYSDYAGQGYDSIKQDVLDNGRVIYHRRFTQRGREFINKLLSE